MVVLICFVLAVLASQFKSKSRLEAENAALRHQLIVLRRKVRGRAQLTNSDRWFPALSLVPIDRGGFHDHPSRDAGPRYMIRDRDRIYGTVVTRRLRAMGIRDKPTAPASPWQNSFVERLIGSTRRECLDHVIVLGEAHLRRILKNYADYYNGVRTHRSLNKDAPVSRPIQRSGVINSRAILGGLHRQYVRI